MVKFVINLFIPLLFFVPALAENKTCLGKDVVVRFEGERIIHVSSKEHVFKVVDPKKEIFSDKTSYFGIAVYEKNYGYRTMRLLIKKNGAAELSLQMANQKGFNRSLNCH